MTTRQQQEQTLRLIAERNKRYKYNRLAYIFPDKDITNFPYIPTGVVHAREKYPKQMDFFNASLLYNQLVLIAPNRSGKSMAGGYADAVHLTGMYPAWWKGRKFNHPIKAWICGAGTKTVRDGIQTILLGPASDIGSGLIPKDSIINPRVKPGTPGAIEMFLVKHYTNGVEDGYSECSFKSYEEEVAAFSSAAIDLIHEDEEPPLLIDTECTARIFSTRGLKYITFTPDKGLSETMLQFFPDGNVVNGPVGTGKYAVSFDMDDVPHFTDAEKKAFFDSLPPYQREAKFYGRPSAGSGVIYPIFETDVQFKLTRNLPDASWYYAYAMDPGWSRTACVWGAYCPKLDTWYIYDTYCRAGSDTVNGAIHAEAIKSRGAWMAGLIDKAANRNSSDVSQEITYKIYSDLGLNLKLSRAGKEVEAGILDVWNRMTTGKLLIASHLQDLFKEMRLYRRDDKGQIVTGRGRDGSGHDLLDCLRYLVRQGFEVMRLNPLYERPKRVIDASGRNEITGY